MPSQFDTLQAAAWPRKMGACDEGPTMSKRAFVLCAVFLLCGAVGYAKGKTKETLPAYVLHAHTVAVIIDPDAGISARDPQANQVAQKDIETALLNWKRFEPIITTQSADLIIVVRKGHGRLVDQTVTDPRQNSRAGVINPTEDGVSIGAQHGRLPNQSTLPGMGSGQEMPGTKAEIGAVDDSFTVFDGSAAAPLDASPAWRYVAKDGLKSHSVPAVAAFRKALEEADKTAAKKP